MEGESGSFLGVTRSVSGRKWRARAADPDLVKAHQSHLGLAEPLARALASRGVAAGDGATFLTPTLKALFPDPSSFADMDRAASLILDALVASRPITVFADYDVDGASSAALLVRWLRGMDAEPNLYVPDRMTEGFGPTPAAFRRIRDGGAELVVTVDCGAAAHDALSSAADIGLRVVVIDHHLMQRLPAGAAALVNPNRPDCCSGQGMLAAAGVTFVLLAALNREARKRGLFASRPEPDILNWLDLAALGAICDVTPLAGFNRALVAQGLKVMSRWENPGLSALLEAAGVEVRTAGVFEAGFILGPRINAGGRIGRSDLGATLLSTDDPMEAGALARELNRLNEERRSLEAQIVEEAIASLEREGNLGLDAPALVVAREGWHPGVVGIVASRLRERYRRTTVVLGIDPISGIAKGSGRSQPGVNLGSAIHEAFDAGLLMAGGGHAMAAGLTLRAGMIPEVREFLCERLSEQARTAAEVDAVEIDALTSPGAAADALNIFSGLAPFGPGNPEPVLAMASVRIEHAEPVRGGHIRCRLAGLGGQGLKAIAWRASDSPLGRRLLAGGAAVHVAGRLKPDEWRGRRDVQMEIDDIAEPRR